MVFMKNQTASGMSAAADGPLYRALAAGDIPRAWLLAQHFLASGQTGEPAVPTIFNCALCLYLVGEYERALNALKRVEKSLGRQTGLETAERRLFAQALPMSDTPLLPLDPEDTMGMERYALVRVRWLTALCLLQLDRLQEVSPILRFLEQYGIILAVKKTDRSV